MSPVADLADRDNTKMADVVDGSRDFVNTHTVTADVSFEPLIQKQRLKSENFDCTPDDVATENISRSPLNEDLGELCQIAGLKGEPGEDKLTDANTSNSNEVDFVPKAKDVFDDIHFKPEDKVALLEDTSEGSKEVLSEKKASDVVTILKGGCNLKVHIDEGVSGTAKECVSVHSADKEFKFGPFSFYHHYNYDVVKERPVEPVVRNDLAVLPLASQPVINHQRAENHQRQQQIQFLFLILLVVTINVKQEVITVTSQAIMIVAIFPGKFAPRWCGLHGEQKTAHGRSSNSDAQHGDSDQASRRQGAEPPRGPGDGSGDTNEERDKEPPRPGPSEQNTQLPSLRHGDIKDINYEIQVVLASVGDRSNKILREMNRCLNCSRLHNDKNCPSTFCGWLTVFITHFLRRSCSDVDCTACRLVMRLVQFHLRDQAEKDETNVVVTDDSVLAFVHEWFPHLGLDLGIDLELDQSEMTFAAEPNYLGKNKGAKLASIAEEPPRMLAGFGREQNEGAIGGFLRDSSAAGGREHHMFENDQLADVSSGSVDLETSGGLGGMTSGLGAISEKLGAMSISSERANTSDYYSYADAEKYLYRFYEDEARPSSRPAPKETRQPTSLPPFARRKKVVPVRPGHIGIGGPHDLDRTCNLWERLRGTGFGQLNREVEREAEGVFLNSDFVEEHSITVDGRYDEGTHWRRLQLIGEGCFGQVFYCQDETTKALFCIKQIALEKLEMSEIKIWGRLDHSGFCNLHGAVRVDQTVLIFMPYVGGTLREFLNQQQLAKLPRCLAERLELLPALFYLGQLLEALYYMEQKGIVHNDLKSANILIDEDTDTLKIIDFGLAHQIQPGKKYQVMRAIGTPIICSPERMRSEAYDYTADVWSSMAIFLEILTGNFMWFPEFSEAGILTLTFKIGDLKAPPMELVPDVLCLPERVLDLFRLGWDVDASTRFHAADLLKLVNGIYTDLECGALTYEEPVPPEGLDECEPQAVGVAMPERLEVITSCTVKLPPGRFVGNESDANGLNFVDAVDGTVFGRSLLSKPKFNVEIPSLEGNQDEPIDGNVPRFLNSGLSSSNQMMMNSPCQSLDQTHQLNIPVLSILDKTHSSESFSVLVTDINPPKYPRSSDLGSSAQPSMEFEMQMQSVTTSGIDPGFRGTTPSYCPMSEMTEASNSTFCGSSVLTEEAISRSDPQDDTDGQMVLPVDTRRVAEHELLQSSCDQSMLSKGSSSSSDEMLEKFQQDLEVDHQRRSFSGKLPDDASSVEVKSPGTPTGSGFSNRSSVSGTSETRRKISGEGRPRLLEKVHENAVASPVPVVVFHRNIRDGDTNWIVSFTCSKEYRQQRIKEVIETVAPRLHKFFRQFTVRDCQRNVLHLDDTIDKILPQREQEIHLLVLQADTENDSWYIEDHEVRRASLY
ncbi:uncharacterized protein LOC135500402 isoform X2 [Lineus longissimus]|uniref:uncharacterized protein LOC135500402 isoform X2 n=1 Tax=Lineus longissimus TaxID=88925 RepID=UPI00315DE8DB